jgi:DMSO/TMAO reductase YedYZ molybdopterin-dependent catalytic subunit
MEQTIGASVVLATACDDGAVHISLDSDSSTAATPDSTVETGDSARDTATDTGTIPECPDPFEGGEFLKSIAFTNEVPYEFAVESGQGWDGRRLYDLGRIESDGQITPTSTFYIRTFRPDGIDLYQDWSIRLGGLVAEEVTVPVDDLLSAVVDQGPILLECSGNTIVGSFGLMSAARFHGVPVSEVLDRVTPLGTATMVKFTGQDEHDDESSHSTPGASWVFTREQLEEAGAFLAFEINEEPLSEHLGFPLRLVVPNWYGCTCIKWLDQIEWVDDNEPATDQMREFASRTQQDGAPELAKDYRPVAMEHCAVPVRIEQWRVDDRLTYRVVGILWGGAAPTDKLVIRFSPADDFTPVDVCPAQSTQRTWTVWSHRWDPTAAGPFRLECAVDDSDTDTYRLDAGYFVRTVTIEEVEPQDDTAADTGSP